jgi:hypothetical protein
MVRQTLKKLKLMDSCTEYDYHTVIDIQDFISDSSINSEFKANWITYEGCLEATVFYNGGKTFKCQVTVYNGNIMDGHRTDLRFIRDFVFPIRHLRHFQKSIDRRFNAFLVHELERREEIEWREKLKNLSRELLDS